MCVCASVVTAIPCHVSAIVLRACCQHLAILLLSILAIERYTIVLDAVIEVPVKCVVKLWRNSNHGSVNVACCDLMFGSGM